jgi:glucosyl-3-phosphoglycerate synthase
VIRSFAHADFPLERVLEAKRETVSVVLPARAVATTIGPIVERILDLGDLVDQLLVIDAGSGDGSASIAAAAGAEVHQQDDLMPELGPVLGKGDALWRSLAVARGEIVVFVDSDTRDFPAHFVSGLVGPIVCETGVEFAKASYRRPFSSGGVELADGGGRVSQLTARPLLEAFYPDLAGLRQPLAGEVAARRSLLERIPFSTGYAVETAMLLDVRAVAGVDAMAQVDLGERRNDHQPLEALRPMAAAVLATVCERLRREGRLLSEEPRPAAIERPPFAQARLEI